MRFRCIYKKNKKKRALRYIWIKINFLKHCLHFYVCMWVSEYDLTCNHSLLFDVSLPVAIHWNVAFCPAFTSTSPRRRKWGDLSERKLGQRNSYSSVGELFSFVYSIWLQKCKWDTRYPRLLHCKTLYCIIFFFAIRFYWSWRKSKSWIAMR